jgi:hypothetical protein
MNGQLFSLAASGLECNAVRGGQGHPRAAAAEAQFRPRQAQKTQAEAAGKIAIWLLGKNRADQRSTRTSTMP